MKVDCEFMGSVYGYSLGVKAFTKGKKTITHFIQTNF